MLEEQIIPRLLARGGTAGRRSSSSGFTPMGWASRMSTSCWLASRTWCRTAVVKLGFRAHYPQIETKLTVRGTDTADIRAKLAPVEAEVRQRLGNFILAEDDQTLEGVVLAALHGRKAQLALVETFTGGEIAARLAHLPGAEHVFRRGIVARDLGHVPAAVGLDGALLTGAMTQEATEAVARAARDASGATHALAVLIELDEGRRPHRFRRHDLDRRSRTADGVAFRRSRDTGRARVGAAGRGRAGLDCLRRFLQGLPVVERIDFEKV